ncbi:36685_t:CDS:10 [Gigaspora margarita]|uniref:36685_t:CDS:1 n=1 Tax=Gigaspora margarita TaxID=4874 RepID=A0ABN7UJ14_GIGMA|nr:36685_t:CDS:10 [Gigaspora margarita]
MTSQLDRTFGQLRQDEELNSGLVRDDVLKHKKSVGNIKPLRTYSSAEYIQRNPKFNQNLKKKRPSDSPALVSRSPPLKDYSAIRSPPLRSPPLKDSPALLSRSPPLKDSPALLSRSPPLKDSPALLSRSPPLRDSPALLSRSPPLNNNFKSTTPLHNGKLHFTAASAFPHIENGSDVNISKSSRKKSSPTKNMFGASSESDSSMSPPNRALSPTFASSSGSSRMQTNKLHRALTTIHGSSSKNINEPREFIEKENRGGMRDKNDDEILRYKQKDLKYRETSEISRDGYHRSSRNREREPVERIRKHSKSRERSDRSKSKINEIDERGRAKSRTHEVEERERAKSRPHETDERGRAKSRPRETEERGRAKSRPRETDERGRAKSKPRETDERERAKSRTRETDERGRAKSRTREPDERGRAKSKPRETDERERAKSRTRESDERGRAKSRTREPDERGRAKSRTRETNENGRAKSRTRETNENGRAKSRTREQDDRERAEKTTRDKEFEILMEKEKFSQLRREKTKHETKHETHHEKDDSHTCEATIYIEELRQYREMTLTSNTTALDVLTRFRNDGTISDADAWTLFEVIKDLGLERPLRDWEFVTKIIGSWELDKDNSLGFNNTVPPMTGFLHLEVKKNKWQKRYFQIKDGSIYHSKDVKGTNETFLCSMVSFDVYTCTQMTKKYQTKFAFALKSQDKITMFLNPENDYIRFLCADDLDIMNNWILSIKTARNNLMRKERPELFLGIPSKYEKSSSPINLDMPLTNALPAAVSETTSLMRKHADFSTARPSPTPQLNTKDLKKNEPFNISHPLSPPAEESKKKQPSGPFKGGSLLDYDEQNPPIKPLEVESVTFAKGSLLASSETLFEQAKEREKVRRGVGTIKDMNGNNSFNTVKFQKGSLLSKNPPVTSQPSQLPAGHLVQFDGEVRFNKGSLLSKGHPETSQSFQPLAGHLIQIEDGVRFHKGSLLAKSKEHHESHSANDRVNRKITGGGPLLSIDTRTPIANSRNGASKLFSPPATTGRTLLDLDLKPEAQHTIGSRNVKMQPLLSFTSNGKYPDSGIGVARIAPPSVIVISGVNRPASAELPIVLFLQVMVVVQQL